MTTPNGLGVHCSLRADWWKSFDFIWPIHTFHHQTTIWENMFGTFPFASNMQSKGIWNDEQVSNCGDWALDSISVYMQLMDARVCCQCGRCSKGICLLLIWATLIDLIFMVYIKIALCTSTIQWFFSESGIETKKFQAKISTKTFSGRFLFNCFLFSGNLCIQCSSVGILRVDLRLESRGTRTRKRHGHKWHVDIWHQWHHAHETLGFMKEKCVFFNQKIGSQFI